MQENSPKTTSSSRRSQTSSDNRGSRSSASNPSTSRRRRDMVQNTAPTNQQQSIVKSGPTRGSNTLPDCEPPTLLFQELSIGASRPRQPKRHLYQKRQESTTKTQSSTTPGSRTASLPDRLHDVHLQERLEEEGLADIAEDDERATAQRRVASAGTSHASTTSPPAASTSKCTPGKASSRPLPEVQEDVNDELSCTPVSDTNSLRFILAQELRALQDGTRSPKLNWPQSRPPSRSSTSSPESVIFENKAAEVIEPGSFLAPKTRAVYPEGQGLPLGLEDYDAGSESSSANPTLDSTQAAKPPPLLPHVYRFGMDLPAQVHAFGGSSEYPIAAPRPMHWISPPRPIPALHGPSSIPYARCPS
ncbi:hypothetical protein FRB90_009382 [Tulasnella sp. 427]|nr:hypothetical protein FRB90_009382 [Tulasnella sp. 427]